MCNKPAFFIIDAASQEVLLVSELTLANSAQTENNGATLVPNKTPDYRTQTAGSNSSKTLTVDQKHLILNPQDPNRARIADLLPPDAGQPASPPGKEKKTTTKLSTHLPKSEAVRS